MRNIVLALGLVPSLVGCVVVGASDTTPPPSDCCYAPPPSAPVNYAPIVYSGDAGVYWDSYNRDDVWYFDASVDDPDGVYDVSSVYADVYDDWTGQFIDTFELYPTSDPYTWSSDWLGSSTYLDPWYNDYSVDLVVYDSFGDSASTTVWAQSY